MTGRLIDADKLKNIVEVSARFSDFIGRQLNDDKTAEIFRTATDGFIKQIDAEPTIDAIPVEWIKKWIFEHPYFCVTGSTLLGDWQKEQRKDDADRNSD